MNAPVLAQEIVLVENDPQSGGAGCPDGYRLLTPDEAREKQQQICPMTGAWDIRRLAGGGSMDGPGYDCKIRDADGRSLGGSLCTNAELAAHIFQKRDLLDNECGGVGQLSCDQDICIDDVCGACRPGLVEVNYRELDYPTMHRSQKTTHDVCDIDRSNWQSKGTDMNRVGNVLGNPCGGNSPKSCWRLDDELRDGLEMDTEKLNYVTMLGYGGYPFSGETGVRDKAHFSNFFQTGLPPDGRYIFVYRAIGANKIVLRSYDRSTANQDYSQYQYDGNCRSDGSGNTPAWEQCKRELVSSPGRTRYLHVRHSQINRGWEPVWCAGEMRIEQGRICRINNASGHFQAAVACLDKVKETLRLSNVPLAPGRSHARKDEIYLMSGSFHDPQYDTGQACAKAGWTEVPPKQ